MNRSIDNVCQTGMISRFLLGNLAGDELLEFECHLDVCESCRSRLDENTATCDDWLQLQRSLTSSDPRAVTTLENARPRECLSHKTEYYRSLLSPSDDPRMMGRIATYEVVGVLGEGGMGIVFKAFDAALNRYVAIKMMAPQWASRGAARQRFLREAQAAAAVVHEHVIAIHSVSEWERRPYLVMPYLRGESLQKRIDDQGQLPLRELLRIGLQVASGLAAAHAQGLIHRDVKPGNILLEQGIDRAVLTDFGLARTGDDIRLTRSDTLVGTPQYMSPEQTRDEPLDFRTDLFSLGSVLYEAATATPAFRAMTSYGVLKKINESSPPSIHVRNPDVPLWFATIVSRLMAKSPSDRIQSAAELETLLRQCLAHVEHPHLSPLPESHIQQVTRPSWFSTRSIVMLTLSGCVTAAFLAFFVQSNPTDSGTDTKPSRKIEKQTNQDVESKTKYANAQEAFAVGAAYYNSRNYKASREPFEAALKLSKDEPEMQLKLYQLLLPSYRLIPEFEPFQTAAEYVITHHEQAAVRSLTRRSYLAFAFQRGQTENLVKRYEKQLKTDPDDYMAVYLLSEIYSNGAGLPPGVKESKRAIELIQKLASLDAKRRENSGEAAKEMSPIEKQKIQREQSKLAAQYVRVKEYKKAAEIYEEIAPLDETTHAWNLKEAASAWLKSGSKENSLRLALAADEAPAEARNDQLTHFFHRNLGDIFMALDQPKKAIPHYEIAIQKTAIEGYLKDTKASLAEAQEKAQD